MTDKAVLLLIFNRPNTTIQVMNAIRRAAPLRLYVAADGARSNKPDEVERCAETRRIATAVDWPCKLKTLFNDENLGSGRAVSAAIDWFFEHEEEGIILEDDCVPNPSFFTFCSELLDKYRDDSHVMSISGTSTVPASLSDENSYFFTKYGGVWGWATWRRAWKKFDYMMSAYPKFLANGGLDLLSDGTRGFASYWRAHLDIASAAPRDIWDYQWVFAIWSNGGLSCMPWVNLVKNIGFSPDATHTHDVDSPLSNLSYGNLVLPLMHPDTVSRNVAADIYKDKHIYGIGRASKLKLGPLTKALVLIPNELRNRCAKFLRIFA